MPLSRRNVLVASAAAAWYAAARPAKAASVKGTPVQPTIDTHQHLWDLKKFRLPWLKNNPHLQRSFVTKDYVKAAAGLNVVKAVYMEVAVAPEQQLAEAEWVLALCRRKDTLTCGGVIGGRLNEDGFAKYIGRFRDAAQIKGVRQFLPRLEAGSAAEKAFAKNVRLLGSMGKRFDLVAGPTRLADADRLVGLCPHTKFVLDHCGNADPAAFQPAAAGEAARRSHSPDVWKRGIARLAKRKNLVCKISGIVARAPQKWTPDDLAPIVNHCLDAFGPDRVMFAGDWPVCTRRATLSQWVHALREIVADRPLAQRTKLWHDNALAFYELG